MKLRLIMLAVIPVSIYILWIYLRDRYEKEPIIPLVKFFMLGVTISTFIVIVEEFLVSINIFTEYSNILYMSFIVAGVTEEGLKAIALIPTLLREKNFNEKLDGIVYSIFLSLGFATVENLVYIMFEDVRTAFEVGMIRSVVSIPAHIMFAITMGYYIAKYKFSEDKIKKREYLMMAILVPVLLHGVFNFILMIQYRWSIIVFIAYIAVLLKMSLDKVDEYEGYSKIRFFNRNRNDRKDDKH